MIDSSFTRIRRLTDSKITGAIPADTDPIKTELAKLTPLLQGAGTNSDTFKTRADQIMGAVFSPTAPSPKEIISKPIDIRVITHLISTSEEFAAFLNFDAKLLEAIKAIRNPVSRVSLSQLIRAYFEHYDMICTKEDLVEFASFIHEQLQLHQQNQSCSDLSAMAIHASMLFSPKAPSALVEYAIKNKISMNMLCTQLGIMGYRGGRFLTITYYQYYLVNLRTVPMAEASHLLQEITSEKVLNARYKQGLLGTEILSILIDRIEGNSPHPSSKQAIIKIAGDPRASTSSASYRKWWPSVGKSRESKFASCLSAADLNLFIDILDESNKETGDADLIRLFDLRKTFLTNLLDLGLVVTTRLFLGGRAEDYLTKNTKREHRPIYARLNSTKTSAIYLNIDNKVHLIEGTHQFRISLYNKIPDQSEILNPKVTSFVDSDLRTGLKKLYINQYNDPAGMAQFTHRGTNWQIHTTNFLRKHGVPIAIN